MLNLSTLFFNTIDGESCMHSALELNDDQRACIANAKAEVRNCLRVGIPRILKNKGYTEDVPQPRFFTQGSWSYKTLNSPAQSPQQADVDDGCYLPLSFVSQTKRPSVAATVFFNAAEEALEPLVNQNGWELITEKSTCIRIVIASYAHIDIPLYAIPDHEFATLAKASMELYGYAAFDEAVKKAERDAWTALPRDKVLLAHRDFNWIASDPRPIKEWFLAEVDARGEQLRRIIRYLKAFRDWKWPSGGPSSILLMAAAAPLFEKHDRRDDLALLNVVSQLPERLRAGVDSPVDEAESLTKRLGTEGIEEAARAFEEFEKMLRGAVDASSPAQACIWMRREFGPRFPNEPERIRLLSLVAAASVGSLSVWVVTDDEERTSKKLEALGWEVTDFTVLTYRVKTIAKPRPLIERWPPHTVKDILSWQGELDSKCRKKVEQRIQEGRVKKANGVLILVESPLMTYGFGVLYKRNSAQKLDKKTSRKNLNYELEVLPMSVVRIDDRYLAERNIPGLATLAGKRIAIIGCGTIGGYLSEMIVKAGAGTSDGTLTLVDCDFLYPQNIGRHRLGFPSLFSNKATAMADELRRLAPGIDIRALPIDVKKANLGELDLLIDATGEEALGHWLCEKYLDEAHMLSVWIDGPGVAVRGLLRSNDSDACYRCLWHKNKNGELNSIHGPIPEVLAGHGCEGLYVPFSSAVSVQAASLGLEMALDWVNGTESPKLRTKIIDNCYTLATPDCNPSKSESCSICRDDNTSSSH